MSECYSNLQKSIGQNQNYGDYRLNKQQQNDFHSIAKIYNEKIIKTIQNQKKMNMYYNYLVKNNEVIPEVDSEKKVQKVRKTRKDKDGRKHICGQCKIGYLSYPALYTHNKTKHNNVWPEGTIKGDNGKMKKRGRPKTRSNPIIYELEQQKNSFPEQLKKCLKRDQLKILDQFQFQVNQDDDDEQNKLKILQTKYFLQTLRQIKKKQKPILKLMIIAHVITVFLFNCIEFFDKDAMLSFEQLFHELINYINLNYILILEDYQSQSSLYVDIDYSYPDFRVHKCKSQHELNYSACDSPQFLPYFIQRFIKQYIIHQDDQQKKLILIDFSNWLYDNKLTTLKLQKNRAEALV